MMIAMKKRNSPSEFITLKGIEYFNFEEDFVEDNVRCIPMIVRFKMDAVGIKLKLSEWSKFKPNERIDLALNPISTPGDLNHYKSFLAGLIRKYTHNEATLMTVDLAPAWRKTDRLPELLQEKMSHDGIEISLEQWVSLSDIKRFTLLKLCRPGHENKNFPKALAEFGLIKS